MRSVLLLLCLASFAASAATTYAVDPARSTLGFTAALSGAQFDGRFDKFRASIAFADADLAGSSLAVTVDTGSVQTDDDERDTALRGPELFHVQKFPAARFVTTGISRKGAGAYEATGKLTIRDQTREIRVPLTFRTASEGGRRVAWIKGEAQIKRLDFGVGQGEWQDTSLVANEVTVTFALRLLPAAAAKKPASAPANGAQ